MSIDTVIVFFSSGGVVMVERKKKSHMDKEKDALVVSWEELAKDDIAKYGKAGIALRIDFELLTDAA
jgi:hypothetical protein